MAKSSTYILLFIFCVGCSDVGRADRDRSLSPVNAGTCPQARMMSLGESKMHFVHTFQGKERLIVFIHGSPGSWSAFEDYFEVDSLLAGYDVVSFDRSGYGKSDFGRPEVSLSH